jgi:hypothetical protein
MEPQIRNIDDLRLEIYRLKGLEQQQGLALRERINSPSALLSTIFSLIPRPQISDGVKAAGLLNMDIVQIISSFLLPFTLNRTLFRRSNILTKGIVTLFSRKMSRFINEESVSNVWDKVKSFIPDKFQSLFSDKNKNVKAVQPAVSGARR